MLLRVSQAVDAVTDALECERLQALDLLDLQQVNRIITVAYRGLREPTHVTVIDALADMCVTALRSQIKFSRRDRERSLAAIAVAFAHQHGLDLQLTPYRATHEMFANVRDGRLDTPDLIRFLRGCVVVGDPDRELSATVRPESLSGCCIALAHPITGALRRSAARDDFLVRGLQSAAAQRHARVLAPVRRSSTDGEPWRDDAYLRAEVHRRLTKSNILIVLGDEASGGVGKEVGMATDLGLTVILLMQAATRSPHYDPEQVRVVSYGAKLASAPERVVQFLLDLPWEWMNSARQRDDRDLLRLVERTRLLSAWNKATPTRRAAVSQEIRASEERINTALNSVVGMELFGVGNLASLHAALEVPPPGPTQALYEFDTAELEALSRVLRTRNLDVSAGFLAAADLQLELSASGAHRSRLDDRLWNQYFDVRDLDGRRP